MTTEHVTLTLAEKVEIRSAMIQRPLPAVEHLIERIIAARVAEAWDEGCEFATSLETGGFHEPAFDANPYRTGITEGDNS